MPRPDGFRALFTALVFRFCVWRADRALARNAVWERRARRHMAWPVTNPRPF